MSKTLYDLLRDNEGADITISSFPDSHSRVDTSKAEEELDLKDNEIFAHINIVWGPLAGRGYLVKVNENHEITGSRMQWIS